MNTAAQKFPQATWMSFEAIARAALANVDTVLLHYLPGGKRQGHEYLVKNPTRVDSGVGSFSISTLSGQWSDFATGDKGGDIISLVAYLTACTQGQAAENLAVFLGMRSKKDAVSAVTRTSKRGMACDALLVFPVPNDAPPVPPHFRFGSPMTYWIYRNGNGQELYRVCRFQPPDGRKQIIPLTLWRENEGLAWRWKAPPTPRPLYGLDRLAAQPDAPVLVCEGEKAADSAQRLLPTFACVTSSNGALSADKSDWGPVAGRFLSIWPDADPAGSGYAHAVASMAAAAGAQGIRLLELSSLRLPNEDHLSDGFDAADFEAERRPLHLLNEALQSSKLVVADDGGWPAMSPIVAELKPVLAFDAAALLPDALRQWVIDEAERMPCAPDFVAVAVMVALGAVIGARCAIKPKSRDTWLVIPNLWGGIVGDPSAKKSPAWGVALKPLDRLIAQAQAAHAALLADYETEKLVFVAKKEVIEGRIKDATKKTGKGDPTDIAKELRSHVEQQPASPKLRRYKTNDSTVEKLGELLRDNPTGMLVLRDELVGLISAWEREGREGDRAFFLEAWNGNQNFDTDRIGRGHICIPNLCVSIFGGIQPDKLIAYLETAHNAGNDGMLQRFQLLVYPDQPKWCWRNRAPNIPAKDTARAIFDRLADFDPVDWGASPSDDSAKFPHFYFDDAAQEVFIQWCNKLHYERMPDGEDLLIRQHLAKFEKLFPALALIFHLIDLAVHGKPGQVTQQAALRAAAWCEYLEAHARRCYGLLKDEGLRAAQALAAKLQQGVLEDGFTMRDVRRHQWRNLTIEGAVQAALDWLEDESWVRGEVSGGTGPGGGRRTMRYRVHPRLPRRAHQA